MPTLSIKGEQINFPEVNASPNWAPAVVQFASATADALNAISGEYDVAPQEQELSIFLTPTGSTENLRGLIFPKNKIYSFKVDYFLNTVKGGLNIRESGTLEGLLANDSTFQLMRSADKDIGAVFSIDQTTGQISIANPAGSGNIFTSASIAFRGTALNH